MKKIKEVLKTCSSKITVSEAEEGEITQETAKFIDKLKQSITKQKIKAEVFIGGSLAKGTFVKKKNYDIDIFVRFFPKYDEKNIQKNLNKIAGKIKIKKKKIHGSRDYYQFTKSNIIFEVVPVVKINRPEQARNVTDLSYFHTSYIANKIKKNKKLAEEIKLAKTFCYAQGCYGAESYIRGFSGYALELLVCYYGVFLKFIKEIVKIKVKEGEKKIIDEKKFYKSRQSLLMNLNESKLASPIVLIDPTFKERNAVAGLSSETLLKFQEACKKFLKKPSCKFFEPAEINKKKFNLVLKAITNKQEGDIAGSKLLKFFNYLEKEIDKNYGIYGREFEYDEGKDGKLYLKVKPLKFVLLNGPPINAVQDVVKFKKNHKKVFIKNHRVLAREKPKEISELIKRAKKTMKEMGITSVKRA